MTIGSLDRPQDAPPTVHYGVESRLAWLDRLDELPAETTEASTPQEQLASLVDYQHPDHDTPDDWTPPSGPRRD